MNRELVESVHANLQATFSKLAHSAPQGSTKQFGEIAAVSAGLQFPVYNQLFIATPPTREAVTAAIAWMKQREVPFYLTVAEKSVEQLECLGLEIEQVGEPESGMVLPTLDELSRQQLPVTISEVITKRQLKEFLTVYTTVFDRSWHVAERVYESLWEESGVTLFTGIVDAKPVACGMLVRAEDTAGVYSIGVVEEFRHQGIGTAMNRAVLRSGREAGCRLGVLQSSRTTDSMYESLGFVPVVTYNYFEETA